MPMTSSFPLFSIVDLGAVVPVEAPHLRVHDALVGGGKHLGRGHVLVVPCVAVAEITCKYSSPVSNKSELKVEK